MKSQNWKVLNSPKRLMRKSLTTQTQTTIPGLRQYMFQRLWTCSRQEKETTNLRPCYCNLAIKTGATIHKKSSEYSVENNYGFWSSMKLILFWRQKWSWNSISTPFQGEKEKFVSRSWFKKTIKLLLYGSAPPIYIVMWYGTLLGEGPLGKR